MSVTKLGELLEQQAKIAKEARTLAAELQSRKKGRKATVDQGWASVAGVWSRYDVSSRQQRAWESLNCLKAVYLYGISLADIHRRAKVAYRTIQYFIHDPNQVGARSAAKIVLATKLLMAERIMVIEEPLVATRQRWEEVNARTIPKTFLKSLNSGNRNRLREKLRKARAKDPQYALRGNSSEVTL